MGGGMGERHQILADRTPRETADRHGVEGRTEFGRPDRLWRLSEQVRQDLDPGHIRRLALIRRHTQRRVALEMFDRAEILARGELHVARRSEERRVGKEWVSTCRSRGS